MVFINTIQSIEDCIGIEIPDGVRHEVSTKLAECKTSLRTQDKAKAWVFAHFPDLFRAKRPECKSQRSVLIDENLSPLFALDLDNFRRVSSVKMQGWDRLPDPELYQKASDEEFDFIVTRDSARTKNNDFSEAPDITDVMVDRIFTRKSQPSLRAEFTPRIIQIKAQEERIGAAVERIQRRAFDLEKYIQKNPDTFLIIAYPDDLKAVYTDHLIKTSRLNKDSKRGQALKRANITLVVRDVLRVAKKKQAVHQYEYGDKIIEEFTRVAERYDFELNNWSQGCSLRTEFENVMRRVCSNENTVFRLQARILLELSFDGLIGAQKLKLPEGPPPPFDNVLAHFELFRT